MYETLTGASTPRRSAVTAAICWILAGVVYVLAEAVAASAFPDYSYGMNYISDLGVPDIEMLGSRPIDSPLHMVINIAFVVHGLLFAVAALCAARRPWAPVRLAFITFAFAHTLGMVMIAVVNGGQHNNDLGLGWVHLLGAFFAFFGGHLTAIVVGISLLRNRHSRLMGLLSVIIGTIGILGIVMLQVDVRAVPGTLLPDGAWERIGMYSIVVWEVSFGVVLLSQRRSQTTLSRRRATALD